MHSFQLAAGWLGAALAPLTDAVRGAVCGQAACALVSSGNRHKGEQAGQGNREGGGAGVWQRGGVWEQLACRGGWDAGVEYGKRGTRPARCCSLILCTNSAPWS